MKRIVVAVFLIASLSAWSQQDPQFTQYMFNQLYFNPAAAGIDGTTKLTAVWREQWVGYSPTYYDGGAPSTLMISGQTPVAALRGGVGGYVTRDKLGPLTNYEVQFSYAYYLQNVLGGTLSFGIRPGMYMQSVDFSQYRATDPNDPLLASKGQESQSRPDLGAGVYFRTEKYYAGISVSHLNQPSFDFGLTQQNQLKPHYYFNAGYFYDLNFDVRLQFVSMVKTDLAKTSFDLGVLAYFKDTMWGGLSFRQSEAAILILGYSLLKDKSLKVGYSLDYIINDQQAKQPTSHELLVSYSLPVNMSEKKIIRTPRFRY